MPWNMIRYIRVFKLIYNITNTLSFQLNSRSIASPFDLVIYQLQPRDRSLGQFLDRTRQVKCKLHLTTELDVSSPTCRTTIPETTTIIMHRITFQLWVESTFVGFDFRKLIQCFQHPSVAQHNKPMQSQFPSVAYLYGGSSKYQVQRPAVTAGFIYKARPDPYQTHSQQPQMQPSYNSYKYQPMNSDYRPSVQHKPVVISDKNQFNPFSDANKLPGDFVPIFKSKNLPYKSYDDRWEPFSYRTMHRVPQYSNFPR